MVNFSKECQLSDEVLLVGIGQDLKKIYSDETRIVENGSLCSWEFRSHIRERKTQLGLDSQMLGEKSKISEFFEAEHPQSYQC